MSGIAEDGHVDDPGNVHYAGLGRPCPLCKKVFCVCDSDLAAHRKVCMGSGLNSLKWRKSDFDDSHFCSVAEDPALVMSLEHQRKLQIEGYEYSLSKNKQWIKRRRVFFV